MKWIYLTLIALVGCHGRPTHSNDAVVDTFVDTEDDYSGLVDTTSQTDIVVEDSDLELNDDPHVDTELHDTNASLEDPD